MLEQRFDEKLKEQVRGRTDIVDLVGQYFQLQRAGGSFKASCPFHKEKTASFMVNPERQSYHCFGCGSGGDVFSFLMRYEGVDFPAALRMLAERAGIPLILTEQDKKTGPLYEALAEAQNLYYNLLRSDQGKEGRDYLASRQVTMDTADKFGLGFAPAKWDFLTGRLRQFSQQVLAEAGLVVIKEEQQQTAVRRSYDRFRNRLMFPFLNSAGKVVGFTGRALDYPGTPQKYLNSPDTELFHKSELLYGLKQAQRAIYDSNQVVIMESNSSLLICNQNGLENVLACSGTAFTEHHRDTLLRKFPGAEIILCFDGDRAGNHAAAKASELMLGRGNTKVCLLPEKVEEDDPKDPDDFIRKKGVNFLREQLALSSPTFDYLIDYTREQRDLNLTTPEGLIVLLHDIRKPLQDSPPESRGILLDHLSQRLKLTRESIEQRLFGNVAEVITTRYGEREVDFVRHEKRREVENRFIKMLIRDGKMETIKYFCDERKALDLIYEQEPRELLLYMKEQADNNPLFLSRTPLFKSPITERIVNEVAAGAMKRGVALSKKYLYYLLTSPLEDIEESREKFRQRIFYSERDRKDAKREIKRQAAPTLEEMEKALSDIEFRTLMSQIRGLPFGTDSSQFESLVQELKVLVAKYSKVE